MHADKVTDLDDGRGMDRTRHGVTLTPAGVVTGWLQHPRCGVRRRGVYACIARKCPKSSTTLAAVRLISIEAAAIAAGVNERTVRRWMADGRLTRYERAGRIRVLVDATELRELVKPKAVKASRRQG